jgi:hypothetical protein
MCPHTTIYVCICVLMLLYMCVRLCPHDGSMLTCADSMLKNAAVEDSILTDSQHTLKSKVRMLTDSQHT